MTARRPRARPDLPHPSDVRLAGTCSSGSGERHQSRIEEWSERDWEGFTLQALWRVCCDGVRDLPPYTSPPPPEARHRDLLMLEATGVDTDAPVHDLLIRFCASFLDQGLAPWPLPRRDEGFLRAFCSLYRSGRDLSGPWMAGLARELGRLQDEDVDALRCISESLTSLGVAEDEWEEFLSATLLALPGWGGMVRQIEQRGDRVVRPGASRGRLVEFLSPSGSCWTASVGLHREDRAGHAMDFAQR